MIVFWSTCWSFHFLNLKYTALQFSQEKQNSTHKSGLPRLSLKCKQSTHPQTNNHHKPQHQTAALLSILKSAVTYRCYQLLWSPSLTKGKIMLSLTLRSLSFPGWKKTPFPERNTQRTQYCCKTQELCFKVVFQPCGWCGWVEAIRGDWGSRKEAQCSFSQGDYVSTMRSRAVLCVHTPHPSCVPDTALLGEELGYFQPSTPEDPLSWDW